MPELPTKAGDLTITPTGSALGAEIQGCDLANPLASDQALIVRRAMLDFGVVFFRGQSLSDEDLVRFTSHFGTPVPHVRKQRQRRVKEVFIISNVKENGEPIGELGDELIPFTRTSLISNGPAHCPSSMRSRFRQPAARPSGAIASVPTRPSTTK